MKKEFIKPAILACSAGLLLTACQTDQHERHHHANYSSSGDQSWMRGSGAESSYSSSQDYSGSTYQSAATAQNYENSSSSASSSSESQSLQDQNEIVIPLHEEQLNVGKRTVDAGQVTIRKIVKTETVSEPVQLRREMLVIDREGAGAERGSNLSSTQSDENWQKGSASQAQNDTSGARQNYQDSSSRASLDQNPAEEPAGASRQSSGFSSESNTSGGTAFQEQAYTIRLQREEPVIQKNVIQTGKVVARKDSQTQQQTIQQQVRSEDVQLDKSGANVEIRGNFAGKQISEPSGAERKDVNQSAGKDQSFESSSQSIQSDSSGAQQRNTGVDKSTDSTTRNRAPTQGQGAQDLKQQSLDNP